jgi:hypothetical protein
MLEDKIAKIKALIMYFMEIGSEINHQVSDMRKTGFYL